MPSTHSPAVIPPHDPARLVPGPAASSVPPLPRVEATPSPMPAIEPPASEPEEDEFAFEEFDYTAPPLDFVFAVQVDVENLIELPPIPFDFDQQDALDEGEIEP